MTDVAPEYPEQFTVDVLLWPAAQEPLPVVHTEPVERGISLIGALSQTAVQGRYAGMVVQHAVQPSQHIPLQLVAVPVCSFVAPPLQVTTDVAPEYPAPHW